MPKAAKDAGVDPEPRPSIKVLGDPDGLETELLGMPCLLGGEPVPVGGARPFEQPREEAEFHNCHVRFPHRLNGSEPIVAFRE